MESSSPDQQTAAEREQKARDLAYQRGKKEAEAAGHFAEIDEHFRKNNGSIARMADQLERLNGELETQCEMLKAIQSEQKTRDRVSKALRDAVTTSAAKQVSTRTFLFTALGLLIAIAGLYLTAKGSGP